MIESISTDIEIEDGYFVRVRVYDEIDKLRCVLKKAYDVNTPNLLGYARQHHLIRDEKNHCRWKNKYFGSIYLARGYFGPEIFEHEKMHIMIFWMDDAYDKNFIDDHEAICLIAGRISAQFWKWFYDVGLDKYERKL